MTQWVKTAILTVCGAMMMLTSCTDAIGSMDNPVNPEQPVNPADELAKETFYHEEWMDRSVKPGNSFWDFALGAWIKKNDPKDEGPHNNALNEQTLLLESHLADYDSPVAGHMLKLMHQKTKKDDEVAYIFSCLNQMKRGEGLTKADVMRNAGLLADMKCNALFAHYTSNIDGTLKYTIFPGIPVAFNIAPSMNEEVSYEGAVNTMGMFLNKDINDPKVLDTCKVIAQIEVSLAKVLLGSSDATGLTGEGLRYPTSTPVKADQFTVGGLTRAGTGDDDLQAVFREALHVDENTFILPETESVINLFDKFEPSYLQAYLDYQLTTQLSLATVSELDASDIYTYLVQTTPSLFLDYQKEMLMKDVDADGVYEMLEKLRNQMAQHIEGLDWMSSSTKKKAMEKLKAMKFNVGAPEELFNSGFQLTGKMAMEDYQQYNVQLDEYVRKVLPGKSVMDYGWELILTNPMGRGIDMVNAAYVPLYNQVFVMPSFARGELFPADKNSAARYATAYIFGHEITHGFDREGAQYDAVGAMKNWWTEDDKQAFQQKQQLLIARFNELEQLPGVKADGEKTLSENMADLGGFALAYELWNAKQVADGLSGEALRRQQRQFFMSYADLTRRHETESSLTNQLATDKHSANHNRVNGIVRLTDTWYDLFGVKPGDKLYLAPADRVKIW